MVGAVDFFRHSTHQTTAIVEAPSTLYRLTTERFQHLEQEHPGVHPSFANVILFVFQTGYANALAALPEQRSDSEVKNPDRLRGLRSFATLRSVTPSESLRKQDDKSGMHPHPEVATTFQAAVIQILGDRLTYAYKEIADLLRS